ncbi:MAG: alpha/beta hydrolase fold domain-containing protein [Acutalibacteraceae bacterium]
MLQKIISFFMAIFAFFASLLGIGGKTSDKSYIYLNEKYGSETRQVYDLYIPKNVTDSRCGLILMIHGGAWISGDKKSYTEETLKYVSESLGMAAATMNYRYISETTDINDILDDIESVLASIKAKGSENGITIDKVMLTGSSAGAHLSMLYAYSRKDTAPIAPTCVVSFCGPTNLADKNFYYGNSMGDTATVCQLMSYACGYTFDENTFDSAAESLAKVSPVTYVDSDTVPTAFAHGMKDTTVPYSNALELKAKFDEYGIKYDFVSFPNSNHSLADDPDCSSQMNTLMFEYAAAYVK